jgi:predicted component of type VI protein secretion system
MAMFNYGIGGQEVKPDASGGMTDLDQNRTLFVQKLTTEVEDNPKPVYDLKTIDEVFQHFQPSVDVEFQDADGGAVQESIRFNNLADFQSKGIQAKSNFLQDLTVHQEQYQKIAKTLKTSKQMKLVLENQATKAAFVNALQALIQELEETENKL